MPQTLTAALCVGAGGFFGALLRYAVGGWVQRALMPTVFPYGTLAVNLLGCFAIGVLAALFEARPEHAAELRLFAAIGLLGGFTTYSSFALDALTLLRDGELLRVGLYLGAHFALGLLAVALGYRLGAG